MTDEQPDGLGDIADELYGLTPADFTSCRNDHARAARGHGDRELAAAITALRRPTRAAWILNQWVRRHPEGVDEIVGLGRQLREAQRRGAVDKIRILADERRRVVAEAVGSIGEIAAVVDVGISASTEREITQTLRAAIADEDTADLLRSGRLVAAAEYSGFGPAGIVAVPDSALIRTEQPGSGADSAAGEAAADAEDGEVGDGDRADLLRVAEDELRRALTSRDDARRADHEAGERAAHAISEVAELASEVDRLRTELDRAVQELGFANRRRSAAEEAAAVAARELGVTEKLVTAARRAVDEAAGSP